jgi:hypothetical protein
VVRTDTESSPAIQTAGAKIGCIAAALVLLAGVGWIDYATGYEISVYALYALPIAWIVWTVSLTWGVFLSGLATACWLWADYADNHHYAHAWIPWERAAMNWLVFMFIAFTFDRFKKDLANKARQVKQLEGILPICIACNRISDGSGHWTDLDTYLREHSEAKTDPRICPDCAGARYR